MTNNDLNLEKALIKQKELQEDFIKASTSGMSPYHLKRKSEALNNQMAKVEKIMVKNKPLIPFDEKKIQNGDVVRKQIGREALAETNFPEFKGRYLEVWGRSPLYIGKGNRMPYQAFKPLEFVEEYRTLRELSRTGFYVYEVVK